MMAARARIDQLKGDKDFYNRLMQKDAGAHAEWSNLHRAGYPSPSEIASAADVAVQEDARNAELKNVYLAAVSQRAEFTPRQIEQLKLGEIPASDHRRALDEIARLVRDTSFRRKLLDGDVQANQRWGLLNAARGCRPVPDDQYRGPREGQPYAAANPRRT
jgi:hypothetical protein